MIHAEHDFTQNFCSAIGYENEFMLRDIIIDEVGRLIVENKADVVKLLRGNGINVTVNDSNKTIANYLTNEISKGNEPVTNGISEMISKNRFESEKYKNLYGNKYKNATAVPEAVKITTTATTTTTPKAESTFWKKLGEAFKDPNVQAGASTLIAAGLKKAFDKSAPKTTTENQANLDERLKINQAQQKAKINYKKIAIIIGIIGVVSFLGYQLYKAKKAATV